jgi:hypothetical protein
MEQTAKLGACWELTITQKKNSSSPRRFQEKFQVIPPFRNSKMLLNFLGIHQISLVINFKGDPEHQLCPALQKNEIGQDVDFLHPSFVVPETGVTMAFKRWAYPYCSVQVCKCKQKG